MRKAKYLVAADLIARRVKRGDYAFKPIPSEERLSEETGVSRMTLRKAVVHLVKQGVVIRRPNGRIGVPRKKKRVQIALLAPAYRSHDVELWRFAIERAAEPFGAHVRPVDYVHPDDPVIMDVLKGFDGVFMAPSGDPLPPVLLNQLRHNVHPVVMLNWRLDTMGIRSINVFPPTFVRNLLAYLAGLGHRKIDCLNAQPGDQVIDQRIAEWATWNKERDGQGQLVNTPVKPYDSVMTKAYEVMTERLKSGASNATAVVCITAPAAFGAQRAVYEQGLKPGVNLSICSIDGDEASRYSIPSITHIVRPDPSMHLRMCLEWMLSRGAGSWVGPLCLEPSDAQLYIGESTGPAPVARK